LAISFSLNEEEVHKLIEQALLGVAGLNLRFEEMKTTVPYQDV
jgi:hypothetical protein